MTKKNRVVVSIEANAINRYMIKSLLESDGYSVHDADSKKSGLELLDTVVPDAILIDLHMPGLDGYAITQHIRTIHGLANTPIIALTTHVGIEGYSKNAISGCDGCIQKPINAQLFLNNLSKFLT